MSCSFSKCLDAGVPGPSCTAEHDLLCRLPAGIAFLVRLRADLLQLLQDEPGIPHSAALRSLSQDLR